MNIQEEQLYERVMERIDLTREMEDEELSEIIYSVLQEFSEEEYLPLKEQIRLSRRLFHSFRKLDVLQELVEDDSITEIMINGKDHIFVERDGRIVRSDKTFLSQEKLEDVIQQIVSGTNRYVNELSPIVDARLEDGSRVNVVLKPVALNGPIMTIRKFPKEKVTMKQLVEWQSITEEAVEFLKMLVKAKYNIFVSGGTGSGKTTFLNALSDYIPKDERIITIEDNAELQIKGVPNLVRLEARNANLEGEGAVTIRDLIKSALRMRPDGRRIKKRKPNQSKRNFKCFSIPDTFLKYSLSNFILFFFCKFIESIDHFTNLHTFVRLVLLFSCDNTGFRRRESNSSPALDQFSVKTFHFLNHIFGSSRLTVKGECGC